MTVCILAVLAGVGLSFGLRVLQLALGLGVVLAFGVVLGCAHLLPSWIGLGASVEAIVLFQVGYAAGLARFAFVATAPMSFNRSVPLGH